MSRGPGRWQRVLLEGLARSSEVVVLYELHDHLERAPTRAELVAARRAARRLAETGQARAIYGWGQDTATGRRDQLLILTLPNHRDVRSIPMGRTVPPWISEDSPMSTPHDALRRIIRIQDSLLRAARMQFELDSQKHDELIEALAMRMAAAQERLARGGWGNVS